MSESANQELLSVLKFIEGDREVTEDEFRSLARWLVAHPESAASRAARALLDRMVQQFVDGVISPTELGELKRLISSLVLKEDVSVRLESIAVPDDSTFADEWLPVVGESHYRDEFVALFGSESDGADEQRIADLICEPDNPYDHNAVAVWIEGHRVGFLSRDAALAYHEKLGAINCQCRAHITAGWDRGGLDRGDYCVRIALPLRVR